MELPVLITKECWMNCQLSIARFSGGFTSGGKMWILIPQANDLVRSDFVKYYVKIGRDRFMAVLKEHLYHTDKELISVFKELVKVRSNTKTKDLFENEL